MLLLNWRFLLVLLIGSPWYRELSAALDIYKLVEKAQVCLLLFCEARQVFKFSRALKLVSFEIHLVEKILWTGRGRP